MHYTPQETDKLRFTKKQSYFDGSSALLRAYKNHQLIFNQLSNEKIVVPMDMYFADQYIVDENYLPLNFLGTLGLRLQKEKYLTGEINESKNKIGFIQYDIIQKYDMVL